MKSKKQKPKKKQPSKLNPEWVRDTRDSFKAFLDETNFPHPQRDGARGSRFEYPEWLIMFIAILSVKAKVKNYLAIHRMVMHYWDVIASGTPVVNRPISERQLRDRLKKICHSPRKPAEFIFQVFPRSFLR